MKCGVTLIVGFLRALYSYWSSTRPTPAKTPEQVWERIRNEFIHLDMSGYGSVAGKTVRHLFRLGTVVDAFLDELSEDEEYFLGDAIGDRRASRERHSEMNKARTQE